MSKNEKTQKSVTPGTPKLALNETDAAHALGLTPRTLQNWRWNGQGPAFVRVSSRCVRYRVEDLEKWAAARVCASTSGDTEARSA